MASCSAERKGLESVSRGEQVRDGLRQGSQSRGSGAERGASESPRGFLKESSGGDAGQGGGDRAGRPLSSALCAIQQQDGPLLIHIHSLGLLADRCILASIGTYTPAPWRCFSHNIEASFKSHEQHIPMALGLIFLSIKTFHIELQATGEAVGDLRYPGLKVKGDESPHDAAARLCKTRLSPWAEVHPGGDGLLRCEGGKARNSPKIFYQIIVCGSQL